MRLIFFLTVFLICGSSKALDAAFIQNQWYQFQANTPTYMNLPPVRWTTYRGKSTLSDSPRFSPSEVSSLHFIDLKSEFRLGVDSRGKPTGHRVCNPRGLCLSPGVFARGSLQPRVQDFLDAKELAATNFRIVDNLNEMEALGLKGSRLPENPWSDYYWPINEGVLGNRYALPFFQQENGRWQSFYDYVFSEKNSLKTIVDQNDPHEIENLSPAEKYDLLIGGEASSYETFKNGFITPTMWEDGNQRKDKYGFVETWMGICHGWAPASFMTPRPTKSILVMAADGKTQVKLFPSDLKGLASYLWAKSPPSTRFMGGRCNNKKPRTDSSTGRILEPECFDINPGDWHIAVVNQIGIAHRSLIMDATYDYQVWNQPILAYTFTFFNPQTGAKAETLSEAMVNRQQFSHDRLKNFRAPESKNFVGVVMELSYIVETMPSHNELDGPENDAYTTVTYMYDLELDEKGKIIGGEWYQNQHPDFMWVPDITAKAVTYSDQFIMSRSPAWDGQVALPKFWSDIAKATANQQGLVLGTIIEPLISRSKK